MVFAIETIKEVHEGLRVAIEVVFDGFEDFVVNVFGMDKFLFEIEICFFHGLWSGNGGTWESIVEIADESVALAFTEQLVQICVVVAGTHFKYVDDLGCG